MKKRTLNQTWILCLRMWRWIAKMIREGAKVNVLRLKSKWFYDNGFKDVMDDCFFCAFTLSKRDSSSCKRCPGKLVDRTFSCTNSDYCYNDKPVAFYKELLRLNRIRKGKK